MFPFRCSKDSGLMALDESVSARHLDPEFCFVSGTKRRRTSYPS